MMSLKIYFCALVLSAIHILEQVASTNPVNSIKIHENVIYDCIDIYAQPSLKHPLLKNHKLQIKPSSLFSQLETESGPSVKPAEKKKKMLCPTGTVPILRTTHQNNVGMHSFADHIFNQTKATQLNMHEATIVSESPTMYTGIRASMSLHNLSIANDQTSLGQISLMTSANGQSNVVQVGWMINPSLFGSSLSWSFGYRLGKDGHGCYNTLCTGFIQISSTKPLGGPLDISKVPPGKIVSLDVSIQKDFQTGNWWVRNYYNKQDWHDIGYWPKELFDQMGEGGKRAVWGGLVGTSPTGSSPPMGNGYWPNDKVSSAFSSDMMLAGLDHRLVSADKFKLLKSLDAKKCYDVEYRGYHEGFGTVMQYGGPGGISCSN